MKNALILIIFVISGMSIGYSIHSLTSERKYSQKVVMSAWSNGVSVGRLNREDVTKDSLKVVKILND